MLSGLGTDVQELGPELGQRPRTGPSVFLGFFYENMLQ